MRWKVGGETNREAVVRSVLAPMIARSYPSATVARYSSMEEREITVSTPTSTVSVRSASIRSAGRRSSSLAMQ